MSIIKHEAITSLTTGIVVDKTKLQALGATDMETLFASVYASGRKVVFVENAGTFFNYKELLRQLEEGGDTWPMIVEHFDVSLTDADIKTLKAATGIRERLVTALKPKYDFMKVPSDWVFENRIAISGTGIVRRVANDGGAGGYSIGIKQLSRIWAVASRIWSGEEGVSDRIPDIRAGGYGRPAVVGSTRVDIGCQHINRYELEQVALNKGWAFPV